MTKEKMTAKTQAPKIKYEETIKYLLHDWSDRIEWLKLLQGAVECKGRIPKSYIYGEYYLDRGVTYAEVFEIGETKDDARRARQQLIEDIINTMMIGETASTGEMLPDHYARLFHALTVLKLEKETNLLPGTTKNMMFDAMYKLWRLDDGSEQAEKAIKSAGWFMAEEIKKRSGKHCAQEHIILGVKC